MNALETEIAFNRLGPYRKLENRESSPNAG